MQLHLHEFNDDGADVIQVCRQTCPPEYARP